MKPWRIDYLNSIAHTLSPILFREILDCIELGKLARIELYYNDVVKFLRKIRQLNLCHAVGDNSFRVVTDANMESWASSLIECSDSDGRAMRFVYIHADKKVCDNAKSFECSDDDLNFGRLLQYPQCCVEAYINWQKDNEDVDPITTLSNSFAITNEIEIFNFPNPFCRYFGLGLFSHFPCSLGCINTRKIAEQSLGGMKQHFPVFADKFMQLENSLVYFQKEEGVYIWKNFDAKNNKILLDKSSFLGQGKHARIFSTIEAIELRDNNVHLLGASSTRELLESKNCFIGAFDHN